MRNVGHGTSTAEACSLLILALKMKHQMFEKKWQKWGMILKFVNLSKSEHFDKRANSTAAISFVFQVIYKSDEG